MEATKLVDIINRNNERRTQELEDRARDIISEIVQKQEQMSNLQNQIVELRAELKKMSVNLLDAKTVLGE